MARGCRMSVRRAALGACLATLAGAALGLGDERDWRRRFESEAPAAWEAYRQASRFAQGVYHFEDRAEEPPDRQEVEQKVNETCRLIRVNHVTEGYSEVLAENPRYSFRLRSGRGGEWVLTELNMADRADTDPARELRTRLDAWRTSADGAIRIGSNAKLLTEVLSAPGTRITAVTPKSNAGAELVEVRFETRQASERDIAGGTLLLDPARNWLPVQATAFIREKQVSGSHTTDYEYGPGPAFQPRRGVQKHEYTLTGEAEPMRYTRTWEGEFQIPARLPDSREFTLSAFGLPEPVGVTWERPTPRYVWFLTAAAGCGLLGFALRWLGRRREAASGVSASHPGVSP